MRVIVSESNVVVMMGDHLACRRIQIGTGPCASWMDAVRSAAASSGRSIWPKAADNAGHGA